MTSIIVLKRLSTIIRSGVRPQDIDLVVLATFTPDMSFPSTACLLQDRLRLSATAIEVQAACSGFMYALITGAAYVASRPSSLALIVAGLTWGTAVVRL